MAERVRKLKDEASQAYTNGRLKEALRLYGQVVQEDPNELGCRIKVGDIHRRLDDRDAAVQAYSPVAKAYAEDGFLLKAIAICKVILNIDSNHTETQQMLADLYAKRRGSAKHPFETAPIPVTLGQLGVRIPGRPTIDISAEYGVPGNGVSQGASEVLRSTPTVSQVAWPASNRRGRGTYEIDIKVGTPLISGEPHTPPPEPVALQRGRASEAVAASVASTDAASLDAPIELSKARSAENLDDLARPHLPLFSELPKNAFIELLVKMEMREVKPGEVLIQEGDVGDAMFIVAAGRVRVERAGEDGRPVVLAYLTDGAFFGEMALLQDGARTASVIVEEESQIFMISKEVLDHVVRQFPSVATVLRNFYRQRLLSTTMATHPLFSPFVPERRRVLLEMFKAKSFEKGEVLLEQGKKGSGLFILLYGALDVVREQDGEPPETLAELTSGDLFGEISLLTGQPVMATVRATADSFVLRLSKKKFDEVIMTHPQILELVSNLSQERRETNDRVIAQAGRAARIPLA